jgi:uncharacterized ion transporter superfamily protein YfcC
MKRKFPHTYVIIFYIILFAAMLTWIVPGGSYQRETVSPPGGPSREVIVSGSFEYQENNPQSWQVFSALYEGFVDKAFIVVFILIVGGAFWIMNHSGAMHLGIQTFLGFIRKFENRGLFRFISVEAFTVAMVMLLFSIFGATFGMSEETIAFVIIFVPLAISMGYDSIVGVSMCFVAAAMGFAGAVLNPFTIGIAQGLSGIPLFSGMGYRLFCWAVINTVGIAFVMVYANKLKKKQVTSPVQEEDRFWREHDEGPGSEAKARGNKPTLSTWIVYTLVSALLVFLSVKDPLLGMSVGGSTISFPVYPLLAFVSIFGGFYLSRKRVHYYVLLLLAITIFMLVTGVMAYQWYIREITALFFAMGLLSGIAMNYSPNRITRLFLDGVKDIIPAALVVGLAGGILFILENGNIMDTILYSLSESMSGTSRYASIAMMYLMQTMINIFIPSGSAQAALTIPIMSQFADLMGISRQMAVLVFQFGDGFTNMITPTSGVLIGVLGMAKIPYEKWFKWALPLIILLVITGFLLFVPPMVMKVSGF